MSITIKKRKYPDSSYIMLKEYYPLPINKLGINNEEFDIEKENFYGIFISTVFYSEKDIVNYEWIFAEAMQLDDGTNIILLKPSAFPDYRIFDILYSYYDEIFAYPYPAVEWSYIEIYEEDENLTYS